MNFLDQLSPLRQKRFAEMRKHASELEEICLVNSNSEQFSDYAQNCYDEAMEKFHIICNAQSKFEGKSPEYIYKKCMSLYEHGTIIYNMVEYARDANWARGDVGN